MVYAVYNHEVIITGQLEELSAQICGVSVFCEKVDIAEYAYVPLREPDVRVEVHLPESLAAVSSDYLLPQVFQVCRSVRDDLILGNPGLPHFEGRHWPRLLCVHGRVRRYAEHPQVAPGVINVIPAFVRFIP